MEKAAAFVFVVLFLASTTLALASGEKKNCYGDICNIRTKNQFCSTYYKLCRNCADIVMDCGTENQPLECSEFCISHKVEIELQRKKDSNCSALSPVANQVANTYHDYQQGDVNEIKCEEGFEPHYTNKAVCGEFGIFRHSAPSCKVKTCSLSMTISNGFVHPQPNESGRYVVNTTVTFGCLKGFTLLGARTATCLGDNHWTETEAPYCFDDAYSWYSKVFPGLVALCSTLFIIVVILIALIRWQCVKRMKNSNQETCTNSSRESVARESMAESGIDVTEVDETKQMLLDKQATDNGDEKGETDTLTKERINSGKCADVIPSAPPNENNTPISNTINLTMHVNQEQRDTTHKKYIERHGEERNADKKYDPLERTHGAEKMPTEETQETTDALQETQEGDKRMKQIQPDDEKYQPNSIALDSVPVFFRKVPGNEC